MILVQYIASLRRSSKQELLACLEWHCYRAPSCALLTPTEQYKENRVTTFLRNLSVFFNKMKTKECSKSFWLISLLRFPPPPLFFFLDRWVSMEISPHLSNGKVAVGKSNSIPEFQPRHPDTRMRISLSIDSHFGIKPLYYVTGKNMIFKTWHSIGMILE